MGSEMYIGDRVKLVIFDQNHFGRQADAELDIIGGLVVDRVGNAYEEFVAAPLWRDDPVLAGQLLADNVPRKAFLVQAVQIAVGDTELLSGQFGQGQAAYQLVLHQMRHQRQLVTPRLRLGLHGGLFVKQIGLDELSEQTAQLDAAIRGEGIARGLPRYFIMQMIGAAKSRKSNC